jgi:hypothetical protein
MKKRSFITFTHGYTNNELTKLLKKSIDTFSEYPIKIYTSDDLDSSYNFEDPNFWKSGYGYIIKIHCCLKSLDEFDEVVWLDTDIIVSEKIDRIWDFTSELDNYPLLPKNRFANYEIEPTGLDEVKSQNYIKKIKDAFGIDNVSYTRFDYLQACTMVFDSNSADFFKSVLDNFEYFDKNFFKSGDESIINGLFWKNNYTKNLGNIFLCSHYFHGNLIKVISLEDKNLYPNILNVKPLENNFDKILFFHGSKSLIVSNNILSLLLKHKTTIHSDLGEIMKRNGSDKSTKHNYTKLYSMLFDKFKNQHINIFELGIGTNNQDLSWNMGVNGRPGASLYSWKEYFPKSNIYSADIDKTILINNDVIKSFHCDQLNVTSIESLWDNEPLKEISFEFMILDGYHSFDANMLFLKNSIHKLQIGGYLVVEDIHQNEINQYKDEIGSLEFWFPNFEITLVEPLTYPQSVIDNSLLIFYRKY